MDAFLEAAKELGLVSLLKRKGPKRPPVGKQQGAHGG